MYEDVKIDLKKTKETIDRLKYVAAKAKFRTLQRIRQQQDEEKLRELEKTLVAEATKAAEKPVKKG